MGNKDLDFYRIQPYDLIMCGYLCIGLIDFMFKEKSLLDHANLFSPNDYEKNGKMIYLYLYNYIALFTVSIEDLKNLKYTS